MDGKVVPTAVALLALTALVANAAVTTTFVKTAAPTIGGVGYNVWDMVVSVDNDWTRTELLITLGAGEFYQDPNGGDTEPTPAMIALNPDLAYDTYCTVPDGAAGQVIFHGARTLDATTFSAHWGDRVNSGQGTWRVAQITLSDAAEASQPQFNGIVYELAGFDEPPVADADGPYQIDPGQMLTVDASGSSDVNNDIVSYLWDLDDNGSFETDAGDQPILNVPYATLQALGLPSGAPLKISVQVADLEGQVDVAESQLNIVPEPVSLTVLAVGGLLLRRRRS